jgi:nucleoid-associated protein EbfC
MTEPPADPFGGFDVNALLEQAQQMQAGLQQAQQDLAERTVEGSVAGGAVTVAVSGIGEVVDVRIARGVIDGDDAESLADLGDLVVAAYRDAKAHADQLASQTLGPLTGGLGGPELGESELGGSGLGSLGSGRPGGD